MDFSTKHIGYLERDYLDRLQGKVEERLQDFLIPPPNSISLVKILGIPRFWEEYREKVASTHYLMEDLVAGLYGEKKLVVHLITGETSAINLFLGTCDVELVNEDSTASGESSYILSGSLRSAYPGIELMEQTANDVSHLQSVLGTYSYAGMLLGTPTVKVGTDEIGVEQIERLIRGLYGNEWGYLVVAVPMDETDVAKLYNSVLNELRVIADSEQSAAIQSAIPEKYKEVRDCSIITEFPSILFFVFHRFCSNVTCL